MANVIPFPTQRRPVAKLAPRSGFIERCVTDSLAGLRDPLVDAEIVGDRIAVRVPFASSLITAEQAIEFCEKLADLAERLGRR